MNSAMSVDVARRVVARPEVARATDGLSMVVALYNIIFQRNPQPIEIQMAMQFVAKETKNQPQLSPAEQKAGGDANGKLARRQTNAGGGKRYEGTKAIQNEGDLVDRKPLTPWETYAQALLFSNEASYVN
jgi:hypothetical protein